MAFIFRSDGCSDIIQQIRSIGFRGYRRSYSSHYAFMRNSFQGGGRYELTSQYFASNAIPASSLRRRNALAQYQNFVTNAPTGQRVLSACSFRPLGGRAKQVDVNGELTSVSRQVRQAELFSLCYMRWAPNDGPDSMFSRYVDEFYESYMRRIGTDDGWQYTNEGQHIMPNWFNRF